MTISRGCDQERENTIHSIESFRKGDSRDGCRLPCVPVFDSFIPASSGQDWAGSVHPADLLDRRVVLSDLCRLSCRNVEQLCNLIRASRHQLCSILVVVKEGEEDNELFGLVIIYFIFLV